MHKPSHALWHSQAMVGDIEALPVEVAPPGVSHQTRQRVSVPSHWGGRPSSRRPTIVDPASLGSSVRQPQLLTSLSTARRAIHLPPSRVAVCIHDSHSFEIDWDPSEATTHQVLLPD